jgi:Uma2 family endonuclease
VSLREGVRLHRFTRAEYACFDVPGIGRTELIDGAIVDVPSMTQPHAWAVMSLVELLISTIDDARHALGSRIPIALDDWSEPEPDVWVAGVPRCVFMNRKAVPADLLLVVEVADSSYLFDRNRKLPLYAAAGIALVWLVDLNRALVEVHTDPEGCSYRSLVSIGIDGAVSLRGVDRSPWPSSSDASRADRRSTSRVGSEGDAKHAGARDLPLNAPQETERLLVGEARRARPVAT